MKLDAAMASVIIDKAKNGRKLGMMVIDEPTNFGQGSLLTRQCNVLNIAAKHGWPVWFVTLNNIPMHAQLVAAAPTAITYNKPRGNAFEVDALRLAVGGSNVEAIVLMGHATNQCVKLTAIGGKWNPKSNALPTPGATSYGYTVMTCTDVLSGGEANWYDKPRVMYYERLMPKKPGQ